MTYGRSEPDRQVAKNFGCAFPWPAASAAAKASAVSGRRDLGAVRIDAAKATTAVAAGGAADAAGPPPAVVVSICAPCPVSTRRPTPRADSSCTVLTRWGESAGEAGEFPDDEHIALRHRQAIAQPVVAPVHCGYTGAAP